MKKYIPILLVLLWAGMIYYASSKTSIESNSKSKTIIYEATTSTVEVTNKIKATHIDRNNEKWFWEIADKWNKPLRKTMHALEFFILGGLLVFALSKWNLSWKKVLLLAVFLCFFYSLIDEYHQTFVTGRNGQLQDCGIDTAGSIVGSSIVMVRKKQKGKKQEGRKI